jgi:hypothetical protein
MRNRGHGLGFRPWLTVLLSSVVALAVHSAPASAASETEPPPGGSVPSAAPSPAAASPAGASSAGAADPAGGSGPTAAPETADVAAPPVVPPPPDEPRLVPSLAHDLQVGLAVMPGGGYRIVFPYKEGLDCGDRNSGMARVCTNRVPFFIDLQPSFGISQGWDFLVDVRLSFEENVFRHHEVLVMPGFRYWLDPQSHVKFFTTLQLAYDATKQSTSTVSSSDVGVRNSNGLMVELMRNFGVYFQFGETVGFVRWLSFNVDAGIGIQARVP